MGPDAPHLSPEVVRALLVQLQPARDAIVLIGGQALNLWAERYASEAIELAREAPFTSKDIDFYGTAEAVERCARLLGGTHELFGVHDRSEAAGVVTTPEGIAIDLVRTPRGVHPDELTQRAVPLLSTRVMHPIHVLVSRAANVVHLSRTDATSLKQLRAAIVVVREFTREALRQLGPRAAHRLNAWAFEVAKSDDGLAVWHQHGVDLFPAILLDAALGEAFVAKRYPQMLRALEDARASARAL